VTMGKMRAKRVALVGLGAEKALAPAGLVTLGGTATRLGNAASAEQVTLIVPNELPHGVDAHGLIARGAALGAYRFTRYLTDKGRKPTVTKLAIGSADKKVGLDKRAVQRGLIISDAVALARDLVNEPPQALYPASFAKLAVAEAKKLGLSVKVFDEAQLAKMDMNLLLAVGGGSAHKPRLVHLTYTHTCSSARASPSTRAACASSRRRRWTR
jgi:leucyl aminopeptidase